MSSSDSWQTDLRERFGLDRGQVTRFETLLELLQEQSDRNLTAVKEPANIVRLHFLDSLWLLGLPQVERATRAVDIGSGAGFPGIALAIARPELQVLMIEATASKASFISEVVASLGLRNAEVVAARAEEAGRSGLRESCDLALARAVGSLQEVLEYALPLLKIGGFAVLQRGAREPGDEAGAVKAASLLGGELRSIEVAQPYPEAQNLHVWIFEKTSATPETYPRRPGMPRKRPLGR
jgi:16S rRNA (guanine527-N7)-methyltransferase